MTRSAQYWHSIVSQSVWRNYKISYQELQSVLYWILESVHFNCIYYAVKFQLKVMSACLCERDNWTCFVLVRLSDQSLPVWREGTCPATLLIGGADAASCSHSAMESQFFIKHSNTHFWWSTDEALGEYQDVDITLQWDSLPDIYSIVSGPNTQTDPMKW